GGGGGGGGVAWDGGGGGGGGGGESVRGEQRRAKKNPPPAAGKPARDGERDELLGRARPEPQPTAASGRRSFRRPSHWSCPWIRWSTISLRSGRGRCCQTMCRTCCSYRTCWWCSCRPSCRCWCWTCCSSSRRCWCCCGSARR